MQIRRNSKTVKIAGDVNSSTSVSAPDFIPEKMPEHRRRRAQLPVLTLQKLKMACLQHWWLIG